MIVTEIYNEQGLGNQLACYVTIDDPNLELIQNNTKIDGIFQSEDRIIHRKDEIRQWLKIKAEKDSGFSTPCL